MLYTLAAAFLKIAFALSAITLILTLTAEKAKDKHFVALLSGIAGVGYMVVVYGDVIRVDYLWVINLLAFIHFGVSTVFSFAKDESIVQTTVIENKAVPALIKKPIKSVRYTWEQVPMRIKILTDHEPNAGSDHQFFADYRLHNGTWFGGTLGFLKDPDGKWEWHYTLSVPTKGSYQISLLGHTFPIARDKVNDFVIP
ncbi:hypothetical protein KC571_02735 [candidate division WWE3 bacterium]|uniref:Uncharacterized protein n=1 Tax=candidate division WWE3 bacterium TaxID=2053526 RepID=A0A955RQ99_UNCKA|nr:hypothetical protein [candidate division WWE3 bacterium]